MRYEVKEQIDLVVLDLYRESLKNLAPLFPLNPKVVFKIVLPDSCRLISYQTLSKRSGTSVRSIAEVFGSNDGCTHYEKATGRYLVAYDNTAYKPRIRWTLTHELGHIMCGHFQEVESAGLYEIPSYNSYDNYDELWRNIEEEADYFAATLLAPAAAIRKYRASSADDIMRIFGLSGTAARYRWMEFLRDNEPSALDDVFLECRGGISPAVNRKHTYSDDYRGDSELLRLGM